MRDRERLEQYLAQSQPLLSSSGRRAGITALHVCPLDYREPGQGPGAEGEIWKSLIHQTSVHSLRFIEPEPMEELKIIAFCVCIVCIVSQGRVCNSCYFSH